LVQSGVIDHSLSVRCGWEEKTLNIKKGIRTRSYGKSLIWIALVVVVGGGIAFFGMEKKREAPMVQEDRVFLVKTFTLHRPGDTFRREYPGTVQASNQVDLSFRVSGPLKELPVVQGQEVAKGDLVAAIDSRDFQTSLNEASSALDNAREQLSAMKKGARQEDIAVAQANLASAQAKLTEAKANYERFKQLLSEEAISEAEFDKYRTSYNVAQSSVAAAQQDLKKAKTGARPEDIQAMEAQIRGLEAKQKAAQDALDDTSLVAPFDGTVTTKYVDNYQDVNAKQPIVRLQDLGDLEVLIYVPEQDISRADSAAGNIIVTAQFDALPNQEFALHLKEWGTQPDNRTQTYPVTFTMPRPEKIGNILPGMAATVEVKAVMEKHGGGGSYMVPVEAVVENPDNPSRGTLWVVDTKNMVVHPREVAMGAYSDGEVAVAGVFDAGERIVATGGSILHDGDKVRLFQSRESGSDQ